MPTPCPTTATNYVRALDRRPEEAQGRLRAALRRSSAGCRGRSPRHPRGEGIRKTRLQGRGSRGALSLCRGRPRLHRALAFRHAAPAAAVSGSRHGEFDPSLLASAETGRRYTVQDVVNAQVTRRELAIAWNLFFAKYDLLLSPTVAVPPFEAGKNVPLGEDGKPNMMWLPYTPQFNMSRHPAVSVPCGSEQRRPPDRPADRIRPLSRRARPARRSALCRDQSDRFSIAASLKGSNQDRTGSRRAMMAVLPAPSGVRYSGLPLLGKRTFPVGGQLQRPSL